jgi:hypothetical protein
MHPISRRERYKPSRLERYKLHAGSFQGNPTRERGRALPPSLTRRVTLTTTENISFHPAWSINT